MIKERLSGNEAIAYAMKQINPDVVPAFPITPSTEIPQNFANFVANGEVDTNFITVESEHSAMSAAIGSALSGARTMTATSANGLAYMWEMLHIASSMRAPIVMGVVNRAISGPLNIHNDHSDSMGAKDLGWMQMYSETNQEAYDNFIMATKITTEVGLPIMVCQDGFITSHSVENIELLDDDVVKKFIGEYKYDTNLLEKPITVGTLDLPDFLMEHKKQQDEAMQKSVKVFEKVFKEFEEISGRKYDFIEKYYMDDAEKVIVILNSTAGTAKSLINKLREKGEKVGLLKIRVFRPFMGELIAKELKAIKAVAILDKSTSINNAGSSIYTDVTSGMFTANIHIPMVNYIYGIGGRDVKEDDIKKVFDDLELIKAKGQVENPYRYLGLRGE
ncbi:MAG: pyruvate ferredoxin oxidoreductase [Tissierellia bacterium]|nr:pyruvate ferredoxin oxidoreductase [Tissierellia bacterium]